MDSLFIVQLPCCLWLFPTLWTATSQASLYSDFAQTHVHWVGDAIQTLTLCHPLLFLPSIFPSIKVFFNESALLIRRPKFWSFTISPFNEYSGLISFRIDWFDLLAVQGTLKSLLRNHSSKSSYLQHSAFFMVQLSHPYMTTEKTIALPNQTFVGKVMSLLFNTLCRFIIIFLPRSNHLLISWLQSMSAVILEPKKENLSLFPLFPLLFAMKWWGRMPWSLLV